MRNFATLMTACILATWVGAIALIAVQNAEPVSLRFLVFQTIEFPFGIVLAFGAMLGILGTAIMQPLFRVSHSSREDDTF
jgi:uncharacterized integral membrane protein